MTEVVLLDDDVPRSQSGQTSLSAEQLVRIAEQKRIALLRRKAKEQQSVSSASPGSADFAQVRNIANQIPGIHSGSGWLNRRVGAGLGVEVRENGGGGLGISSFGKRVQREVIDLTDDDDRNVGKIGRLANDNVKYFNVYGAEDEGRSSKVIDLEDDERRSEGGRHGGWISVRDRRTPGYIPKKEFLPAHSNFNDYKRNILQHMQVGATADVEYPEYDEKSTKTGTLGISSDWKDGGEALAPRQAPAVAREKPNPHKISLSKQQLMILTSIAQGKSVFVTGSAGTGKSFILEYAIRVLKRVHGDEAVFVTASTGLAACALGGTTLHSFAGVGLGVGTKEAMADKVMNRRETRTRWRKAKALIIDEISMIDGEFFDTLDYVGRVVTRKSGPFGGIQLVVTGDFFQLPPVNPINHEKFFAFEADCWSKCFHVQVELSHVFRQADSGFVQMLNEIRRGNCSRATIQRLQKCAEPLLDSSGVVLTRLYPRKMDVGRENEQNLRGLQKNLIVFNAHDTARSEFAKNQLTNLRVDPVIHLCVGAQVMLVKNLDTSVGLVNGARGVVVGFTNPADPKNPEIDPKIAAVVSPTGQWPIVKFACDGLERMIVPESWTITEGDLELAKRTQVPLLLAWALSVHKCQGMTLDRVHTDLSRAFDFGMVYVALSRVKSLEGLRLIGFDPSRVKVHPKVSQFYGELGENLQAC